MCPHDILDCYCAELSFLQRCEQLMAAYINCTNCISCAYHSPCCCMVFIFICRPPIMNFHKHHRECVVTLSAAKGLSRWAERCFAALSMTGPALVVKVHYRRDCLQPCELLLLLGREATSWGVEQRREREMARSGDGFANTGCTKVGQAAETEEQIGQLLL